MRSLSLWKVRWMFPWWKKLDALDRFHHTSESVHWMWCEWNPNKKYKLIFTVIICCLELLCWTRSPFQQHFPDKRDATRYYIFDFIVLIIWEHIDTREIKGLFFFLLCVVTLRNKICYLDINLSSVLQNQFYPLKNLIV